jgi:hypothetical protein
MTEQADTPGGRVLYTSNNGLVHVQAVAAHEADFVEVERPSKREGDAK